MECALASMGLSGPGCKRPLPGISVLSPVDYLNLGLAAGLERAKPVGPVGIVASSSPGLQSLRIPIISLYISF